MWSWSSHPRPPDRSQHGCTVGVDRDPRVMLHPGRVVEHQSASSCRAGRCVVVRRTRCRVPSVESPVLTFCSVTSRTATPENLRVPPTNLLVTLKNLLVSPQITCHLSPSSPSHSLSQITSHTSQITSHTHPNKRSHPESYQSHACAQTESEAAGTSRRKK